ncbi:MAG: uroporphyrinogen-III decarboxylase-like protein [Planctomycetes bacterium]|nr:uroporphyrinogen-III decarboxylase-like protein [Planctomycetota bacterium]
MPAPQIMTPRQVVLDALAFKRPGYVPWAWEPTQVCARRLREYLGTDDLTDFIGSHFLDLGSQLRRFAVVDGDFNRDAYGVLWDRTIDKDIGVPVEWPIRRPEDLDAYRWPDPLDPRWYEGMAEAIARNGGRLFTRYKLGFSLYERAWTMRGMTDLLMDMVDRPEFVDRLLDEIVEHNLAQIHRAIDLGVDAIYFGDDYGSQRGLIMGHDRWRRFIKPRLARMFAVVRQAGKVVCLHSCGKVAELFDELVEIGLNVFNPFQPEVMDVFSLKRQYHGRLAFHGGLSIQKTLPFGTPDDVRRATRDLVALGRDGGYILSPSHAVPADVPPENLVAMMDELRCQVRSIP